MGAEGCCLLKGIEIEGERKTVEKVERERSSSIVSCLEIRLLRPVFVLPVEGACAVTGQGYDRDAWGLSIVCVCSRGHGSVHCRIVRVSKEAAFMSIIYKF